MSVSFTYADWHDAAPPTTRAQTDIARFLAADSLAALRPPRARAPNAPRRPLDARAAVWVVGRFSGGREPLCKLLHEVRHGPRALPRL